MSENEIYYLNSILRQLREFRSVLPDESFLSIGAEVLADNINWLECHIAELEGK